MGLSRRWERKALKCLDQAVFFFHISLESFLNEFQVEVVEVVVEVVSSRTTTAYDPMHNYSA